MAGIVNGERDITVTVLSGAMAAVEPGQTCYIGTTPGGHDLGRLRVRQSTATKLILAENSVQWKNAWYLTVTCFHEPWGVYPRIVLDASNIPTFYKDYDILYDDQNYNMDPVICMGPNHAAFLDAGSGSVGVYYTSSGTFNPTPGWEGATATGSIAAYHWFFGNGPITPTGSNAAVPGYVSYTGAGHYCTKLDVVTVEGVTGTGWRHVSIYDRPNEGPKMPPLKWGFDSLDGSISQGGYSARLWLREVSDWSKVVDGALVVLWTEAWEGGLKTKVGGNSPNRDSILFVGYIDDGSIRMNPETNRLEFGVSSITETLKNRGTFSAALDNVLVPTSWNEMREMTVDRAVIHYLRWHSTALAVADFSQTGDTKPVHFVDFDRGAVYDTANSLLDSALVGWMVADRQGKMWCETNPSLRDTGTARSLSSILDLTRQDWMGEVGIETRPHGQTSYIEMGGLAFTGPTTGTDAAFLAGAPGEAPGYFGSLEKITGLVVSDQEQLNRLTGHFLAKANSAYPRVDVNLAGDYRLVDLAPQQRVLLTMGASENWRGLVWNSKPFLPEEVSLEYRPESQAVLTRVALVEETQGDPGVTVTIPEEAPWTDNTLPEWNFDWTFPVMPPFPIMPPIEPPPSDGEFVYIVTANKVTRTHNFYSGGGTGTSWEDVHLTGVTGSTSITGMVLEPSDPDNTAYLMSAPGGHSYLYKTSNLSSHTPTWTVVVSDAQWRTLVGGSADSTMFSVDCSVVVPGLLWLCGRKESIGKNYVAYSLDGGTTWVLTSHPAGGGNENSQTAMFLAEASRHSAVGAITNVFARSGSINNPIRTQNMGGTWSPWFSSALQCQEFHVPFQGNPSDTILYWSEGTGSNKKLWRSTDSGTTKTQLLPKLGGADYAVRGAVEGSGRYGHGKILSMPANRLNMLALLDKVIFPEDNKPALFSSADGGDSWLPLHAFASKYVSLAWSLTNSNLIICVAPRPAALAGGEIVASADAGLSFGSWVTGWENTIGWMASGTIGFSPIDVFFAR